MSLLPRTVVALLLAAVVCAANGVAAQTPTPPPISPVMPAPEDIEPELLKVPLFVTLRDVDPEGYAMALNLLKEAALTKQTPGVIASRAQGVFQSRTSRWVLGGSDAAVIDYTRAFVGRLDAIGQASATDCHGLAIGEANVSVTTLKAPGVANSYAASFVPLIGLLESNRGRVPATFTDAEVAERTVTLAVILALIAKSDRDIEILADENVTPDEHARSCELHQILYKRILDLPAAEAADLLRFLSFTRQ